MDRLFSTNSLKDAIFSLEMTNHHLVKVQEDLLHWKWVILTLHNSLQGFMATAICGPDGTAAVKDRTKDKRHIQAYQENRENEPKILDFLDLYERVQSSDYMCQKLVASVEQAEHVCQLNTLRSELMHYFPSLLMNRDPAGWLPMIRSCVEIIEFLCFESGMVLFTKGDDHENQVRELLSEISAHLARYENAMSEEKDR